MRKKLKKQLTDCLLELDRSEKGWLFIYGLFIGILITYLIYFDKDALLDDGKWMTTRKALANTDSLQTLAEVVASIFGISIPIAISTVSDHLKPFNDPEISNIFRKEPAFRIQIGSTILLICTSIFLVFLKDLWTSGFCVSLIIMIFIYSLYQFTKFITLVLDYTTNTDEKIFKKTKDEIDAFLKNPN